MNIKQLRDRWFNKFENETALLRVKEKLRLSGSLKGDTSPFGETQEGYLDFRGIDLSDLRISHIKIEFADLSSSILRNVWLENSIISNSKLDKTDLSEFSDHGNKFDKVTFTNTKFNKAIIGYKGSNYLNCIFENSNFSKSGFIRTEFNNCLFLNCKLNGVDFNASSFEECSFSGNLSNVWFRGGYGYKGDQYEFGTSKKNLMKNVSFENAYLNDVHFSNHCNLSTIKVPKNGSYLLFDFWKERLETLNLEIQDWPENELLKAKGFLNSHLVHAENQNWYLINLLELQNEYGIDMANNIVLALKKYGDGTD
ncbi:MAG: pentapeptide repeat-containing protein [Flavobacteriaceae bacterium]|nr:pentapeptide repeat-containing protein [Flavobacteriaceae bacterium]